MNGLARHKGVQRVGLILAGLLFAVGSQSAQAFQLDLGEVQGSLDTTVSYGVSWRTEKADRNIIGRANGGFAYSVNGDDGNLNYDNDRIVSNTFKATSDLELKYRNFGAFLRGTAFYDMENEDQERNRTELSSEALDLVGKDAQLLDAYLWWDFELGSMPAQIRLGDQVLSWGESTFIQNSINTINPFDVNKLRVPGSELREALVPVGMVSASVSPTENFSLEGFYQYDWENTEVDPPGSYWSSNDFVGDGGSKIYLGFGDVSDLGTDLSRLRAVLPYFGLNTYEPDFLAVSRIKDDRPSDDGQFGLAMRFFAPELNDTEFGLYFINYHSRLPIISARTGDARAAQATFAAANTPQAGLGGATPLQALTAAQGAAGAQSTVGRLALDAYANTANYFIEYPENIQLFGASFNTQVPATGTALQGEISYRNDAPTQIDDTELLLAALTPIAFINPAWRDNQIGTFGSNTIINGYEEIDLVQVQMTATQVFGPTFGADQFVLVGEVGATHVPDMPSRRLEASGTNVTGNPTQEWGPFGLDPRNTDPLGKPNGGAHAGKYSEPSEAFADATSWGYRAVAKLDYNNAIGSVTLSPRLAWAHDVHGNSPGPGGNFLEHRKAVTFGITADYQKTWSADLSYTEFFGAGRYNLVNDRDFVAFNLKYSF